MRCKILPPDVRRYGVLWGGGSQLAPLAHAFIRGEAVAPQPALQGEGEHIRSSFGPASQMAGVEEFRPKLRARWSQRVRAEPRP